MSNKQAPSTNINEPSSTPVFEKFIFPELKNVRPVFPDLDLLNETLGHLSATKDERALAIVGALLLEASIDDLLHTIMPGYKPLRNNKDFSFSTKIALARAMSMFPAEVFNGADTIRLIRNAFAHNLSVKSLAELPKRNTPPKDLLESMRHYYLRYSNLDFEVGYESAGFEILIRCMIEELYFYRVQVWLLNEFIRSKSLLPALNEFCVRQNIDLNKISKRE